MRIWVPVISSVLITINALALAPGGSNVTVGMNLNGMVQEIASASWDWKCLDLPGGKTDNGNKLWLWDCNGLDNQKWIFVTYANGKNKIVSALNHGKCIDVPGGDLSNGNQLQLWDCNGMDGQSWGYDAKWKTIYLAAGSRTASDASKCMDLKAGNIINGNVFEVWDCLGNANQQWTFRAPSARVQEITYAADPSKCMDLPGGNTNKGTKLWLWDCTGQDNQKWIYVTYGFLGSKYKIVSALDPSKCVDVPGGDVSNGNQLQLWDCNGANGQLWGYDAKMKTFYLSASSSDASKCMDLKGGSATNGNAFEVWDCNGYPNQQWTFAAPLPGFGPGKGPWQKVSPESVGLKTADLQYATTYINSNVKERQCFLMVKDGKLAWEWYVQPSFASAHMKGWSMTKSVGAFLVFRALTLYPDKFNVDYDISSYGVRSPKPYKVTTRMMMSMTIGGETGPGELWRYDSLGNLWLNLFPKVLQAATGRTASSYLADLMEILGIKGTEFEWANVDWDWSQGAKATCRAWARFGQLILNNGVWDRQQIIAPEIMTEALRPEKFQPYNFYSNPCYGWLFWLNADKNKYNGCCWEASRLPNPKCNKDTFMPGAVTDMSIMLGLYGGVVMTLPSVNTLVVGFGLDLRPIEPTRIGYYPGICKALNIPCNKPEKVPAPKCGASLECIGMSAQCFSGGESKFWNHRRPLPGQGKCVDCLRNRMIDMEKRFPADVWAAIQDYCPKTVEDLSVYMSCFCYHQNSNPWEPWQTTTTTSVPNPPDLPDTPAMTTCGLTQQCLNAVKSTCPGLVLQGYPSTGGGEPCYKCLNEHNVALTLAGCPNFNPAIKTMATVSDGFCVCGLISHYEEPRSKDCRNACRPDEMCLTNQITRFVTCMPPGDGGFCTQTHSCPIDLPSCANGLPCPVRPACVTFLQSHPISGCVLPCTNSNQCPPKADGPGIAGCYYTGFKYPTGQPFLMCGWGNGNLENTIANGTVLHTQGTIEFHGEVLTNGTVQFHGSPQLEALSIFKNQSYIQYV